MQDLTTTRLDHARTSGFNLYVKELQDYYERPISVREKRELIVFLTEYTWSTVPITHTVGQTVSMVVDAYVGIDGYVVIPCPIIMPK